MSRSMEQAVQTKHRSKRHFFPSRSVGKICHVIHCVVYAFLHDVTCRSLYLPQRNVFLKHVSFYTADIVCIARKGGPGNLRCGICDISLDSSCQAPTW